ncbi:MAG: class II aldolase/adducin family protein [Spirochaetaceae bacterium]|jgi:L-fuculose-phosphate aldolase|nr:class II aldolase/adducin family protein [Spirochaetaceae bacterium]
MADSIEKKFPSDGEARQLIIEIGRRMYDRNFVAANDGNITCRVSPDEIWATPTGVSKGFMKENELIKLRLDGTVLKQGPLKVSSEIKMHLRVYLENPNAGGVTHAHPPFCTSFAIAGLPINSAMCSEVVVTLGVVPCVHYETPGTQGIPDSIAPYCRDYNAVLLANHGALSWGKDLIEAWYRLESMEHFARIQVLTEKFIGKTNLLSREQVEALIKIRESIGISGGGFPAHCADKPQNLTDVLI